MNIFDRFITLKEAGAISGYHPDYIGELVRSNKVKGTKVGNKWYVSRKEVRKYLSKKHHVPIAKVVSGAAKAFLLSAGIGAALFDGLKSKTAPVSVKSPQSDAVGDQNRTQDGTAA
jgi:excisionase family DNA binding protein